jgi:hypothetical protein
MGVKFMNEYDFDQAKKLGNNLKVVLGPFEGNPEHETHYYEDIDLSKSRKSREYKHAHAVMIPLPNQFNHVAHIPMMNPETINVDGKDWVKLPYFFFSRMDRKWKTDITYFDPLLYVRIMMKHNLHSK